MKNAISILICLSLLVCAAVGCSEVDHDYGVSSETQKVVETKKETVKVPEIKSDDAVMPTFFDISLYDEENYADIYLGKDFKYKVTYAGSGLTVPSSYREMLKEGWSLKVSEDYNEDSQILAGKSMEAFFINEYDREITAVFYNSSKSSISLKRCPIVKFRVEGNILLNSELPYGQFWINGVSNESAITDIIQYLGAPSHFLSITPNNYMLDYFITEKDRRSGITMWIDIESDCITTVEFSYY